MYRLIEQDFSNHRALHKNRLPARAYFLPWENRQAALEGTVSSRVTNLNGVWQFRFFDNALLADLAVVKESAVSENGYVPIDLPCSWQFAGFGDFLYTDEAYPFPVDPPHIPAQNPTGVYKRTFEWDGEGQLILRLEGVESFCRVYANHMEIGFTKGSRLPAEFDLSPCLKKGSNELCLVVHQYCDGSYLEDQDMWWLGGVIRDVLLVKRPKAHVMDIQVDADFEPETREGLLSLRIRLSPGAEARVSLLDKAGNTLAQADAKERIDFCLPGIMPWSAEIPTLYTLLVEAGENGQATESVPIRIGFRRVEIKNGQLKINGVRVMLRGVNRHEFCPWKGRAISYERTREDLLLMKKHHINAVRTSHYPNNPFFYQLCDELGLYVMDECDLELHGFLIEGEPRRLMEDENWQPAFLDRAQRMVARDYNHPCVIMWSLGNESHSGKNIFAMYDLVKNMDPIRPIHYEGDMDYFGRMDVSSSMYSTLGLLMEIDEMEVDKPHIHCEFAHAMGNGPGSLLEYVDLMEASRRIQGYFVWEWRDHGVYGTDREGRVCYRHGGEFGEKDTSGKFCMDGLLASDSTPTPGFYAYAKAIEPLKVTDDGHPLGWLVKNRFDFKDTAGYKACWTLRRNGRVVKTACSEMPRIMPHDSACLPVPEEMTAHAEDQALWTLDLCMEDDGLLVGNHRVTLEAFPPQPYSPKAPPMYEQTSEGFKVNGRGFSFLLSFADGCIHRYQLDGKLLMNQGPRLDFFRAYIDNDCIMRREWEKLSMHNLQTVLKSARVYEETDSLRFVMEVSLGANARLWHAPHTIEYRVYGDGKVLVDIRGEFAGPFGENPRDEVPRIGTTSALPGSFDRVCYLAHGPGESYCDSKEQAPYDLYQSRVEEMSFPYECPQEQGNRTGCHFVALKDQDSHGIGFVSLAGRDMSCKTCSDYDLLMAAHRKDVPRRDEITVHFDLLNSGLGSASCGPGHLRPYVAKAIHFAFGFGITPFKGDHESAIRQTMDLLKKA